MKHRSPHPAFSGQGKSLHRVLAAQLRRDIAARCQSGDALESQNELAARFRVSVLTVREALSVLEGDGIIERRRGSGTVVLDPLRSQRVGVVIEQDIASPRCSYHFRRCVQMLRRFLEEHGLRVRLYVGSIEPGTDAVSGTPPVSTCPDLLEDLEAGTVRGLVAVGGLSAAVRDKAQQMGVPVVGNEPGLPFRVAGNPDELLLVGVQALLDRGCNRLGFMSWMNTEGIIRVMRQHRLALALQWLRNDIHPATPGAGWSEFREIWAGAGAKPDGLLITDENLFAEAVQAMVAAGVSIPGQLTVVTHASRGAPIWAPFPFVRVEEDPDAMAQEMVALLKELLANPELAGPVVRAIPVRLVPEGESVAEAGFVVNTK